MKHTRLFTHKQYKYQTLLPFGAPTPRPGCPFSLFFKGLLWKSPFLDSVYGLAVLKVRLVWQAHSLSPCPLALGSGLLVYVRKEAGNWEGTEKADEVGGLIGPWSILVGCTTTGKLLTRHVSIAVKGRLDCTWTHAKQHRERRPVQLCQKHTTLICT